MSLDDKDWVPQLLSYGDGTKQFSKPLTKDDIDMLNEMTFVLSGMVKEVIRMADALEALLEAQTKNLVIVNSLMQGARAGFMELSKEASATFLNVLTDTILEEPLMKDDAATVLEMMTERGITNEHLDEMKFKNITTRLNEEE